MTQEFDPGAMGLTPDSPEAYQADEALKEEARRKQEDENVAAGLNPDGTPKVEPTPTAEPAPPEPAPAVEPAPAPERKPVSNNIAFVKDAMGGGLSLGKEQLLVKEKLAKEDRYAFYLPLDPGEKKGAVRAVTINGYRCEVPKGMQVQLPESIYRLLVRAYDAEAEVLNDHENNLAFAGEDKRRALGL